MLRPVLILLLGSGIAQAGPLLFAPLLSRLYGPEVFGPFHLATAVAANVAVVACARYEFALPLAASADEARALRVLCLRILFGVVLTTLALSAVAAWQMQATWPLAVPPLVAVLGLLSLWTMQATREQAVHALSVARVLQFWGCGVWQAVAGLTVWAGTASMGATEGPLAFSEPALWGLLGGPIVAAALAAWWLWRVSGEAAGQHPLRSLGFPSESPLEPQPASRAEPQTGPSTATPHDLKDIARTHRDFPLLNTPHAFLGALQDTLSLALIAALAGPAAAGVWAVAVRLLKAPATLAGGAVSQVLYPQLAAQGGPTPQARAQLRRVVAVLLALGLVLTAAMTALGPQVMPLILGPGWDEAGPLSQALALYIGLHFVASPLGVVTLAWQAQAWALKASLVGQLLFLAALAFGLAVQGSIQAAAWNVSVAMAVFFAWYAWRLLNWPQAATIPPS